MARFIISFTLWSLALLSLTTPLRAATYSYDDTVPYSWLSSSPINVTWEGGDCTSYPTDDDKQLVDIGFTFNFAGTEYTQVRILSNGALQFGADQGFHKDYTNDALPITNTETGPCPASPADRVIAGYWDDLNPRQGGSVTYETMGTAPNRLFVVSWVDVPHHPNNGSYTFQIILHETSNEIKMQYGAGSANGASATIGVEVSDTDYTEYSFNTTSVTSGDAILFYQRAPQATLDLRLDEYTWSGTANDVLDSSGNGHHGIAVGDADTIATGKLCRAGSFDGSGDYLTISGLSNLLNGNASLAFWINTTQSGDNTPWRAPGVSGVEQAGGTDDIFWGWLDASGHIGISVGNDGNAKSSTAINDGTWHHVVLTRAADTGAYTIYVDGELDQSGATGAGVIGNSYSSIGRIEVTGGTPEHFEGLLDEVRVFDGVLTDAQVQTGYDNQAAGLNWDGSARECPAAGTNECLDIPTNYGVHGATKLKVGTDVTINGNPVTEGEAGNTLYPDGVRTDNSPSLPLLTPESFPENDSETEIEVDGGESATINPGSYKEIKLKEGASATFSPSGGEFHIGKLNAKDDSTLTFAPGTYYIDEFNAKEETTINVSPDGEVKIYIGDKFTTDQKSTINTGGSITDFQVYLYPGSKLKLEEETQFTGFVYAPYADNEIELKKEVDFKGSFLSSGEVEIKENVTLHFSEGDQQDLANNIACGDVGQQLDHIRLEHDGVGLTCMAETVTILACADADCTEAYGDEVTVDLTSPASGWNSDPVTFSGGSTTVKLRHTTAETVTIAAVATSPTVDNPTLCVNSGGDAACELVFAEVGVLIDGDDSDATPKSDIVTQIAGKPSNVAPPNPALQQRVRVVRTDNQTGACVAGVGNETLATTFQYLVPTPAEGLDDNTVTVTGNTSADLASAGNGALVELAFDANGTAPFNFTATDAGRYRLRVDLEIPVTDAAGAPTGETIPATDTSNDFVVRPLALFADAAGNPRAQSADGDAYQQAGTAFSQTFTSLRWTAGRDGDNDGLWDDCGSSTLADPGTPLARVPAWNIGQPAAALVLPAAGNDPGLSYGDGNVTLAAADSGVITDNVAYPEVGIIQFQGSVSGGFLGEPVGICSPYIGRFYPDHFLVTIIPSPPTFTDACIAGNYSYLGEPFPFATPPIITISAMNGALSPAITRNYDCGGFWKFAPSMDLAYSYTDSSGNSLDLIPAANTVNPLVADTIDCSGFVQLTLTDTLTYARPAITSPIDPFAASVDLAVDQNQFTDSDLVCYDTGSGCQGFSQGAITGTTLRHGIIQVFNNFGPETMDITHSPFAAHYYDGTSWVTNTEDECSTALAFCSSPVAGRVTPLSIQPDPLNGGLGTFTVTTAGTFGEIIDVCLTAPAWLSETDCTAPGPTCGAFTFGIYRGNDRIINWQEIIQ